MKGKDILSVKELSKEEIQRILQRAYQIKHSSFEPILKGCVMASCFFEPSTRTRLSFESAMKRCGGEVIGFSDASTTSVQKGESLSDNMKVMGFYADVLVIRHPTEGSAKCAAEATHKPVINAGDGANEHPTQTLLDLFTIQECQGKLDKLHIAFVGDLLYGRTVHSLASALKHYDCCLYFVSPPSLSIPENICEELKKQKIPFSFHSSIEEVIDKADILYMTRIQKERFTNPDEYLKVKDKFILSPKMITSKSKPNLKILHPLPRVNEIEVGVDRLEQAYYFSQAENGIFVRAAILAEVLGR